MQEELLDDFAHPDEKPALREWYFPDFRFGYHGTTKFAFYGLSSFKRFKGQPTYNLDDKKAAQEKLAQLHAAWDKKRQERERKAAEAKAKAKPPPKK